MVDFRESERKVSKEEACIFVGFPANKSLRIAEIDVTDTKPFSNQEAGY